MIWGAVLKAANRVCTACRLMHVMYEQRVATVIKPTAFSEVPSEILLEKTGI